MKTLKKLFSVSAIVALLGTLAPMYAFGAGNSLDLDSEFPAAYAYAYANGITTQSEDNVDMGGKLTRIALAKMVAKYAINVLKLTPDTSKTCNFTDVTAALDAQYDNGVTQACQLGLMGVNITAFRPNDLVTRGEFGTTFSRALNANSDNLAAMNAADPYYKEHLNYLNKEGIMKVIDPNMLEVRGYVMLMMMRSDESYTAVEGCTAEELLACFNADDYDACIAACSDEEPAEEKPTDPEAGVTYGNLTVSKGSSSVSQAPKGVAGVEMGSLKFRAGDENVKLTSIDLTAIGYGRYTILKNVYLIDNNGNRVTRERNVDSDGNVSLDFLGSYELKANTTATFTIAAKIGGGDNGDTYGFKATKVSGPEKVTGLPVETELVSVVTINNLGTAKFDLPATLTTEKITIGEEATLGEFKIGQKNQKEDLKVVSIKVKHEGEASLDSLDNLYLAINGESVADKAVVNGKYVTFTFNDGGYLLSKDRATALTVKLMGTATAEPGKTVKFVIDAVEDLVVKGETYGYTIEVDGLNADTAITANNREIVTANIATSFEKNVNKDILATQSDVLFGTLKIKSTENNFEFENLYATIKTKYATQEAFEQHIKNVKLGGKAGDLVNINDNGDTTYTAIYKFEGISLSKGTQRVLDFTMDTKGAAGNILGAVIVDDITVADGKSKLTPPTEGNITYQNKLVDTDNDVTYLGDAKTDDVLSAQNFSNTMTVNAANLKVSRKALPDASYVASNGKEIVIAKGTLEAGSNSDVKITNIKFTDAGNAIAANVIGSAKLVIGENEYRATVDTTNKTYTVNREIIVAKGSEGKADFELVVTLKSAVTEAKTIQAGIANADDITAEDSEGTPVDGDVIPLFSTITLNLHGSLSITSETTDNNKYDKSILAGESDIVAEYQIKANNEKVKAQTFVVKFDKNISKVVDSVVLGYNGKEYTATPSDAENSLATFADIDMEVDTTKAPLSISVNTIAYSNNSDKIVKDVKVVDIDVTKGYGIDSLESITFNTAIVASKVFDVVPATVLATVKSSTSAKTELELTVNKGNNTKTDEADFALTLKNLLFDVSFNANGLESFNVKDSNNALRLQAYTMLTETTCMGMGGSWAENKCTISETAYTTLANTCGAATSYNMVDGKYCARVWDATLNAGSNLFTVNYTVGSAGTPSYTIDLKDVNLSADYTPAMTYGNRMASTLNLVTK